MHDALVRTDGRSPQHRHRPVSQVRKGRKISAETDIEADTRKLDLKSARACFVATVARRAREHDGGSRCEGGESDRACALKGQNTNDSFEARGRDYVITDVRIGDQREARAS